MSADLFAEFNSLSSNPTPPPAQQATPFQSRVQQQQPPPPPPPPQQPQQTGAKDPFDFFGTTSHASPISTQPWPSLQTQPAAPVSWGTTSALSKPVAAVEDDDDGWGDFEVAEPSQPSPANPSPFQVPTPTPVSIPAWGSPAAAGASSPSIPWHNPSPGPALAQRAPSVQQPPTRVVRASTLDLMSNSLVDIGALPQKTSSTAQAQQPPPQSHLRQQWQHAPTHQEPQQPRMKAMLKSSASNDPSVLFDAEDFELQVDEGDEDDDDDEFGEFETVAPPPPSAPVPTVVPATAPTKPATLPSMDLLSLDEPEPPSQPAKTQPAKKQPPSQLLGGLAFGATASNYPQAPKSPSFQDRNPFPDLAIKTPTPTEAKGVKKPKEPSPVTAWPSMDSPVGTKAAKGKEDDEGWGAWDDFPPADIQKAGTESSKPPESWDWDAVGNAQPSRSHVPDDAPPPINVPPPSVILSVFPDLLNSGNALFKPISGQTASIKQRILSDPKAGEFLQSYILLAMTAARVIAGRKQRWHRDKILAKSMSISAAGSKGMKLAGVDKTQSAREDREAADVVAVWRQQVGRLRSAVAAAKAAGKGSSALRVPEISESMSVQTAKMVPTAPKACIICGLKREERVAKVDFEVEDSFGEWWVDHWGHKACKNFWIEHEQQLRQR